MKKYKLVLKAILDSISIIFFISVCVVFIFFSYVLGYRVGYNNAIASTQSDIDTLLSALNKEVSSQSESPEPIVTAQPQITKQKAPTFNWDGPQLWEAVNKRRVELGVNSLSNKSELCTIASIRLNELLELGKLDGHEGFSNLPQRRPDLSWIFDEYNVSEFLVYGAQSATEAVALWENTLGHKILLTGGEYVWGCTYAQNGFGVAIAAY